MTRVRGLILFGAIATIASEARADSYIHRGVCKAVIGSNSCVEYSSFGVHNVCATAAVVECPLITSDSVDSGLERVLIGMYDRNSTSNISCDVVGTNADGTTGWGPTTIYSSAGGPGTGFQSKISIIIGQSSAMFWRARCTIPPAQSGQFSHVVGFLLNTN
jgi:hypothetical protein